MFVHAATILSACAYLALCLLAAGARLNTPHSFPVAQPERKGHTSVLARLLALSAWLGIPFGALPAFVSTDLSGAAVLICLAVSAGCDAAWRIRQSSCSIFRLRCLLTAGKASLQASRGKDLPANPCEHFKCEMLWLQVPLRLGLALSACAWYARQRGVPGELLSLDAYAAMPIAGVAEGAAAATGLALLGLGALPLCQGEAADTPQSLRHLAGLAVWMCLFMPVCPARGLGLEGVALFVLDGLYFWGRILILDYVLRLAAPRVRPPLHILQTLSAVAGAWLLCLG